MNFVKRKGCSTAKPMVHGFEEIKAQFLGDVVVKMESILVLNWDHTHKYCSRVAVDNGPKGS